MADPICNITKGHASAHGDFKCLFVRQDSGLFDGDSFSRSFKWPRNEVVAVAPKIIDSPDLLAR